MGENIESLLALMEPRMNEAFLYSPSGAVASGVFLVYAEQLASLLRTYGYVTQEQYQRMQAFAESYKRAITGQFR